MPAPPPPTGPPPPTAQQTPAPPPPAARVLEGTVVVENLSKWFGDVVAVSNVSFGVSAGVTALLGPNGAGKSTALRMIAGLTRPSQGSVMVLGKDPRSDKDVRGLIGLVSQEEQVFAEQRALTFVTLAAQLNGMPNAEEAARAALGVVELDPDDTRSVSTYSKGMRQRVKVAQAIVHKPHLLLLDEPLTGLDPRQRLHMIELIQHLGASGVCVIVSSHVLEEVERLGSRVLVIAQGRLAAQGDFHQIRTLMDDRPHRILVRAEDARQLGAALFTSAGIRGVTVVDDHELIVDTDHAVQFRREIAPAARAASVRLLEVKPLDDDLESVFKYLVATR